MNQPESKARRMVRHSTIYAIGNISRQMVGFLMLPVYTHFLTPADYGVVGLLTFAVALLEPFFGARLGDAMMKFYYEENEAAGRRFVISTSLIITGLISLAVSICVCLARGPASETLFGTQTYSAAVGWYAFIFATQALEYYGLTFIRIQQKPILFIVINLSKLVLQLTLNITFIVYMHLGLMGVVYSGVISSGLYAAAMVIYLIWWNGTGLNLDLARRMFIFSWPLWLSSIATLYIFSANRYLIRVFGSLAEVGYFELAAKFAAILTMVVWQPFSQFWEIERFEYHKKPDRTVLYSNVFQVASTLLFIGALGISVYAGPTISVMSAPEFHAAARVVPWLTFGGLFCFLTFFVNFSFLITGKTVQITRNIYIFVVVVTVLNFALIPPFGYMGAGYALAITLVGQFLHAHHVARSHYDMGLRIAPVLTMLATGCVGYTIAAHTFHFASLWMDLAWRTLVLAIFVAIMLILVLRSPANKRYVSNLVGNRLDWILNRI